MKTKYTIVEHDVLKNGEILEKDILGDVDSLKDAIEICKSVDHDVVILKTVIKGNKTMFNKILYPNIYFKNNALI